MSLILSGTDGLSDVDGSAATPAIRGTDANTGMFFPAADTIAFTEGGVESMRIDSAGNVGIGTSSPSTQLQMNSGAATYSDQLRIRNTNFGNADIGVGSGVMALATDMSNITFYTSSSLGTTGSALPTNERMRIDSSGNVGINNTSPAVLASTTQVAIKANASADSMFVAQNSNGLTTAKFGFQFTGGVDNPVIGSFTNHPFLFLTNNTERMRITSAGNVGIGTSSPSSGLEVYRATSTTGSLTDASLMLSTTATTGRKVSIGFGLGGGVANTCAAVIGYDVTNGAGAGLGDIYFSTRNTTADSTPTERMRITSGGDLLVGTTSFSVGTNGISLGSASNSRININNNTDYGIEMYGSTSSRVSFYSSNGSSTRVGAITVNTTNTTYGTSSDYRLKENIAPMTGALAKVQALKPVTYTWKADGSEGQGFIAHELQEVIPDAVVGEKDAVDKDGKPTYQGVDTSYLVATLTAAIQELKAELDSVKAELQTLKGN